MILVRQKIRHIKENGISMNLDSMFPIFYKYMNML